MRLIAGSSLRVRIGGPISNLRLLCGAFRKNTLNAPIRNEPDECNGCIYAAGNPWTHESQWDCDEIKHRRELPLPITADSSGQQGLWTLFGNNGAL